MIRLPISCLPSSIGLEKFMIKWQAGAGHNGSPQRHVWHAVFIEECKSLVADIDDGKVEEYLWLTVVIVLSQ